MERKTAIDCIGLVGTQVLLKGWVERVRTHGKISFFDLRDRTGVIQIAAFDELASEVGKLSPQDVVEIEGEVKARGEKYTNPDLETGTVEVKLSKLSVIAKAQEMPFDMGGKDLNLELPTLLDYRTLSLRHQSVRPIFKIQEAIMEGFRLAAKELECTEIFTPTISYSSTEGGAEVFPIDYYGKKAFLTQSPQLYKQMVVPMLERVYTIAHAYRAEPSVTTYHLSEVTQLDCEFGFVSFDELLDLLEEVGRETLFGAAEKTKDIFKEHNLEKIAIGKTIPRLKLREAQKLILDITGRDVTKEPDLSRQDELDICAWAKEKHNSDLVTITHFPTKKRAFYTMPDPKDPTYSLSYDILFRGVEIASGSLRRNNYDDLVAAIKERGMNPDNFAMYLMAFKYGMPKEGGFSYGLERMTMKIMGLSNIRQASLFPRDMERVDKRLL